MAIEDVAKSLVQMCNEGKFLEALDAHYHEDIVSVEAAGDEQMPRILEGIKAVRGKSEWWAANHEVHNMEIKGPYYNGDQFSIHMAIDVTSKPTGQRMDMNEVCLYEVKDDKIVKEHFFYDTSQMG